MELKESVSKSYSIKQKIKDIEAQIEKLNKEKEALEKDLKPIAEELLKYVKENKLLEVEVEGVFVNYFKKSNVGYTSDKEVLDYLKDHGFTSLITKKVTESLDKKALKKELKTNTELKEALDKFIVEKVSEYVTVTDAENHDKMINHINEGKETED